VRFIAACQQQLYHHHLLSLSLYKPTFSLWVDFGDDKSRPIFSASVTTKRNVLGFSSAHNFADRTLWVLHSNRGFIQPAWCLEPTWSANKLALLPLLFLENHSMQHTGHMYFIDKVLS
jgi:hypothetical protein